MQSKIFFLYRFTEELVDLSDESRARSEMGHEDETNYTTSLKGEAAAIPEVKKKGIQGTENQDAWKMRYTQDFGAVHSKNDSPQPVFKGIVWNSLRTAEVKKVFSDLGSRLLRPPSSDVMHMRPLIRENQGTVHFVKPDQETSQPLVSHSAATVVPSEEPEMLPMSKYFDYSQSQQKVTTTNITSTEGSSITSKSVCILLLCAVSNCCFNSCYC